MYPHYYLEPRHEVATNHPIGAIVMLVFWVGLVILVLALISHLIHKGHYEGHASSTVQEDPLEAAKLRYAKGEITKTEFGDIKKELAK